MSRTLGQLLLLLGSEHDGEVLAAVAAIRRTLSSQNKSLHDLAKIVDEGGSVKIIHVEPALTETWDQIRFLIENDGLLSDWEHDFVRGLRGRSYISPKQKAVIDKIVAKLRQGGARW